MEAPPRIPLPAAPRPNSPSLRNPLLADSPVLRTPSSKLSLRPIPPSEPSLAIDTLPAEIQWQILLDLPFESLVEQCQTSSYYRAICQNNDFWRRKFSKDFPDVFKTVIPPLASGLTENWRQRYEEEYRTKVKIIPGIRYRPGKCIIDLKEAIAKKDYSRVRRILLTDFIPHNKSADRYVIRNKEAFELYYRLLMENRKSIPVTDFLDALAFRAKLNPEGTNSDEIISDGLLVSFLDYLLPTDQEIFNKLVESYPQINSFIVVLAERKNIALLRYLTIRFPRSSEPESSFAVKTDFAKFRALIYQAIFTSDIFLPLTLASLSAAGTEKTSETEQEKKNVELYVYLEMIIRMFLFSGILKPGQRDASEFLNDEYKFLIKNALFAVIDVNPGFLFFFHFRHSELFSNGLGNYLLEELAKTHLDYRTDNPRIVILMEYLFAPERYLTLNPYLLYEWLNSNEFDFEMSPGFSKDLINHCHLLDLELPSGFLFHLACLGRDFDQIQKVLVLSNNSPDPYTPTLNYFLRTIDYFHHDGIYDSRDEFLGTFQIICEAIFTTPRQLARPEIRGRLLIEAIKKRHFAFFVFIGPYVSLDPVSGTRNEDSKAIPIPLPLLKEAYRAVVRHLTDSDRDPSIAIFTAKDTLEEMEYAFAEDEMKEIIQELEKEYLAGKISEESWRIYHHYLENWEFPPAGRDPSWEESYLDDSDQD